METMQLEKIKITGRIQIFAIDDLSDFEQISWQLRASVSSSVKWGLKLCLSKG